MKESVWNGILEHIRPLSGFEYAKLLECRPGFSRFSIEAGETALNLYGKVHGGFLFTLCDIAAGMATYAYEVSNVTLQGNINFVKGAGKGILYVECNTVHKGRTTAVNEVKITDENGRLICTGTFSMYITGEL